MNKKTVEAHSIWQELWESFRSLPLWVQLWTVFILTPINMASLFFLNEPKGWFIAILVLAAVLPNLAILWYERGFSKLLSIPRLLPMSVLVGSLLFAMPEASGAYGVFLWVLLVVDGLCLLFDYPEAVKWVTGQRDVVGHGAFTGCK